MRVTKGSTVIMGRLTWESMARKPLTKRRNVVITCAPLADVEHCADVGTTLKNVTDGDIWFIGGARIFEEAMKHADVIDRTYVPDQVTDASAVKFPAIDEKMFEPGPLLDHEDEPGLKRRVFTRRR
jgi:dihydrofolate reductase